MKVKKQNTIRILLLATIIFGMGAFLLSTKPVLAATGINKQINFQGKVVNTDGTNVSTASYNFLFCIYTTASPATACTSGADNDAVWRESKSVTVTDGIFQTNLGDTTALPGSVDFNTDNIYLGVNFNSNGQMTPLVRFTAAPYAMNADKVHGLTVTDTTGTLTITAGKTLTASNTLTFQGTDGSTLNVGSGGTLGTAAYTASTAYLASGDSTQNGYFGNIYLDDTNASHHLILDEGSDLTADRILSIVTGDSARTLTFSGNLNVSSDATISNTNTGDQSIFQTFAVSGQSNVVADSTTDTVTLIAGTNITITTNATNDEITINAAGGGSMTVRESDTSPSVSSVTTLEFGPASTSSDEFIVTDQTGGVARVIIGDKVGKLNEAETVTAGWTFNTAATTFTTAINANGGLTTTTTDQALTFSANGAGDFVFNVDSGTFVSLTGGADGVDAMTIAAGGLTLTDGDLNVSAGDANVTLDVADTFNVTSAASATADAASIVLTSTSNTSTLDALSLTATASNQTDQTVSLIRGSLTAQGTVATDIGYGLFLDLASQAGGTETAIKIQNTAAWNNDIDFQFEETLSNATDDTLVFTGVGGTNNTSLTIDLDGAGTTVPTIVGGASDLVAIFDGLTIGIDGATTENISAVGFAFAGGNDLYVDDMVGINGNLFVDGTITAGSGNEVLTLATGKIDADAISLITTGTDGLNTTSSATGLATYTDRLSLLQGCADGQVLKWVESTDVWNCADDSTGGGGAADTAKFTDSTPAAMADNNTTEIFNDATAPNITPDSTSNTVLINVSVRTDGNSTSDSINHYRLVREDDGGSTNPACDGTDLQVGVFSSSFTTNTAEFNYATGTFLDGPASTAAVYYTVCSSADSSTTLQLHTAVTVILVELGADLAENYYTSDDSIEPGDVVAIEGNLPAGVKKSGRSYDPSVIGVVSTAPGITLDDAIGLGQGRAVPVALAGRIPVKVSTENGRVAAGDYLTSSSVPGVAMKATKAGIVIGQALESFNYADDTVGRVMTFVKNIYFDGMRVVDAEGVMLSGAALLQKMLTEKNQAVTILDISEIATDRLSAGLEIITPKVTTQELATDVITSSLTNTLAIQFGTDGSVTFGEEGKEPTSRIDAFGNATFAGTVTAKSIRAESIEGLEIFTNQISSMEDKYAGLVALAVETTVSEATEESTSTATLPMDVVFRSLAVDRVSVNFDADILGKLSAFGGLVIGGKAEFHGDTLFRKLASFFDGAIFKGSVMFEKTPTFNSDMAGFAVVTEGDRSVEVIFDEEYAHQPIVTVTLTSDVSPLYSDVSGRDMLADIEAVEKDFVDAYFENDIRYIVTKKGMRSFTIVLNKKAPRDLQFSWVAIAVKDSKTSLSQEVKEDSSETEDSSVIMDIAQSVSEPESLSEEGGVPQLFEPVVVVESEPESEAVSMPLSEETETVVENPQSDAVSVPAVQSDLSTGDVF